jgi:hypothetical protein
VVKTAKIFREIFFNEPSGMASSLDAETTFAVKSTRSQAKNHWKHQGKME